MFFEAPFAILDASNENMVSSTYKPFPGDLHGAKLTHLDASQKERGNKCAHFQTFTAAAAVELVAAAVAAAAVLIAQQAPGTSIKILLIQICLLYLSYA